MIKSFIYLDEQKMYSLSSQIFEGISEYVLNESSFDNERSESQKGPINSGRILADVIKSSNKEVEKKFLHDYSFTIFEKHLLENRAVLEVDSSFPSLKELKESINKYSFIKISAKAVFNDIEKITELLSSFNIIGKALAHMSSKERIDELTIELKNLTSQTKDKNKISKLKSEHKRLTNLSRLAKEQNLYQDPEFLKNLELLTKYGFSDQFEVLQYGGEVLYTSCLIRDFLREKEDLLVKKYSRKTEKEVVVLGVISQAFSGTEPELDNDADFSNMKAALLNIVEHLANVEGSISGKQDNEVVIDPIAVYFEL